MICTILLVLFTVFSLINPAVGDVLGNNAREVAEPTALDLYAHADDGAFAYELVNTVESNGFKMHVIDLTSQKWRTEQDVDLAVWKHWLTVYVPKTIQSRIGLVLVGGGSNPGKAPEEMEQTMAVAATASKSVVALLGMVPNQPVRFTDEDIARGEDDLIAYTWDKYLKTGDPLWLARLPMTKSVVRAMDAIQLFLDTEEGGKIDVDSFVVAGGSKRGWTTWTAAAVDRRVVAICPAVIDMLNVVPSFIHHWNVYGFWAPAVGSYENMGIMEWMRTPEYAELHKIVEPYSYIDRYKMSKYIVNSTGDQFFLPDSSQFYWDDLPGPKYLRYVPNTDHGLSSDAYMGLASYLSAIASGTPLPEYSWSFLGDGSIRVETPDEPIAVKLWQATNPDARDFRKDTIGAAWTETDLERGDDGSYTGTVSKPEKGWTAFLVELTFKPTPNGVFKVTSAVRVVPDVMEHTYRAPEEPPKGFFSGE